MSDNANSRIAGPSEGWVSRFGSETIMPPDGSWSEIAWKVDDRQVKLLAKGLLRIHPTKPGQGTIPDHVYAESRTTLAIEETEILPGCPPSHALIGGFVTLEEALLEFPQPQDSDPVPTISASPVRHFAEGETITPWEYPAV